MTAKLHNITQIYFGGFFIRGHSYTMHAISYAINFWSGGTIDALFLRHEGYLGAIGAFVRAVGDDAVDVRRASWDENFAKYSILREKIGAHVLDQTEGNLVPYPLLDTASSPYAPDAVDLGADPELREYWLANFVQTLPKLVSRIKAFYGTDEETLKNLEAFQERFVQHLSAVRASPK